MTVLWLPAEAEENDPLGRERGEWLWDDAYGYAAFQNMRRQPSARAIGLRFTSSSPRQRAAIIFQAEWLKPYGMLPARDTLRVYGASDYAVTTTAATIQFTSCRC